jgi:hypothetical protein
MKYIHHKKIVLIFIFCIIFSGSFSQNIPIGHLIFLSQYTVPYNYNFNNTTVGGLSGIDYDAKNNIYYLISDDRSAVDPARFYSAKIIIDHNKIDTIVFVDVKNMLQQNGTVYPSAKQDRSKTPDPEAMRLNPVNNQLIWTSEGERIVRATDTVLENPAITVISTDGKYIDTFPLPSNLLMHATENGPRQNAVLEGLTFADAYKTLFVSLEEPLFEDGPRADVTEKNPFTRIFKFDVESKKNIAQYAYKLDPIAYTSSPENAFKLNGIPDILSIGNEQLIVMERSYSTGRLQCTIKLFLADFKNATNIIQNISLQKEHEFIPASKKLLLNLDSLGIYIDNLEGITFGPDLANGHKTLVLVADNNFNDFQKTQFILFEVIP